MPGETTSLPAGVGEGPRIDGGVQGQNDFGKLGWGGPCPPPGATHRYVIELFALDAPIRLPPGSTRSELERAMLGLVIGRSVLVGRYSRGSRS